ncbi:response regulator [Halomonas beimenensis]|uniref:Response regulator receiver domain protein (CheY-like) n=1 Tax=Halomonas beimenensis TaxID=475662 RepID=A0A291PAD6_9GAMM|nr:response regulator [Halomonas beimenensis]ATJ83812.1 response regulator receiver domain protein (CheY-like) [Halomonas beimenensis]
MRVETDEGQVWSRLVKPILWPVLSAQGVLVLLCLALALSGWWLMPGQASWGATFGLLLALLVGSSLNVAVFLMLFKQRLRAREQGLEAALAGIGRRLEAAGAATDSSELQSLMDPHLPLSRRLDAVTRACEVMAARWQAEREAARGVERRLTDDLEAQRGRLARLETGRVRAREESRLKSGYLVHLQQMLGPLLESVERVLDSDVCRREASEDERAAFQALQDRLAETAVLLETLGDPASLGEGRVSGRVLVVDDGPVNLMLAQKVLERQGLEVATATSGKEALTCLEKEPFDLVFMDIYMADMDGVATCRAWRAREAEQPGRPRSIMVALTANAGDADRRRFREAGMDDYLAKPYRPQDLLARVRHWLPGTLTAEEGA